jgi:hypothetical protein
MSRHQRVTRTCDLDPAHGDAAPHRVEIDEAVALGIDLCAACHAELLSHLAPCLRAGRPAPRLPDRRRTVQRREEAAEIRAFAVERGLMKAGSRGRIPGHVITEYEAAKGRAA